MANLCERGFWRAPSLKCIRNATARPTAYLVHLEVWQSVEKDSKWDSTPHLETLNHQTLKICGKMVRVRYFDDWWIGQLLSHVGTSCVPFLSPALAEFLQIWWIAAVHALAILLIVWNRGNHSGSAALCTARFTHTPWVAVGRGRAVGKLASHLALWPVPPPAAFCQVKITTGYRVIGDYFGLQAYFKPPRTSLNTLSICKRSSIKA